MIKLLRSALVSSSPPFTLAAKCRPYSCAEYSRGKETISADTLYSERYSDFGRHCSGDNYLSALSALRLQETTLCSAQLHNAMIMYDVILKWFYRFIE